MRLYKSPSGKCNISGQNVKKYREDAGLSQEQLAAKIQLLGHSINQKAISRIETGDRVMPDFELIYFSEALGIPIEILLETRR
jgi:transcriptional regulator with XRE-family HTH domain